MTNKNTLGTVLSLCMLLLLAGFSGSAHAVGFDNGWQGIRGLSMGTAFTGVADDATAIFYNPAGLSRLETGKWQGEFRLMGCFTNFSYTEANKTEHESDEIFPIPGFFIGKKLDKASVGFGMYVPYGGGGVKYDELFNGFEYMAGLTAFSPSASYQFTPELSVGMTATMYFGQVDNNISAMNYEGEWMGIAGFGVSMGAMYLISDQLSLGATVRSPVNVSIDGTETIGGIEKDSEFSFDLSPYYCLGIGYQVTNELLVSFDFVFTPWSHMDKSTVTTDGVSTHHFTENDDTYKWCAGLEYNLNPTIDIRGGLMYETGASESAALSFASCDIERFTITGGIGYDINERIELGLGFAYVIGFEEEYGNQEYDQDHLDVQLAIRFNF